MVEVVGISLRSKCVSGAGGWPEVGQPGMGGDGVLTYASGMLSGSGGLRDMQHAGCARFFA